MYDAQNRQDTYFAPAERSTEDQLSSEIDLISNNQVVNMILASVVGFMTVLNDKRQAVAINEALVRELGVDDPHAVFGLRLGEIIGCIHSGKEPNGCGTTPACRTCGAVLAMMSSLETDLPQENECVATVSRNGSRDDLYFKVRSSPIEVQGERFLLFFLQNATEEQYRASLERVFFHDTANIISGLSMAGELVDMQACSKGVDLPIKLSRIIGRLSKEVEIQRTLSTMQKAEYHPSFASVWLRRIFEDVEILIDHHPATSGKSLEIEQKRDEFTLVTDTSLIVRILCNMVINAFEATDLGGKVKMWLEETSGEISFCVWNDRTIPEEVRPRVFQRNFSTKEGTGRGLGTYSMKLFGEKHLGGKVDFTSTEKEGTVFRFRHPIRK